MRGKAWVESPLHDADRITPAYAGKSGAKNVGNRPSKDHPRLCGEKLILLHRQKSPAGSPPPMRGKGRLRQRRQHHRRITPAYAGKSFHDFLQKCQKWDHPRLCGEKLDAVTVLISTLGSPPPMRGKVVRCFGCRSKRRITPAYAGKSCPFCRFRGGCRDHPRLCGEKLWVNLFRNAVVGSPPPMRGKVLQQSDRKPHSGITPAYAGKRKMKDCKTYAD